MATYGQAKISLQDFANVAGGNATAKRQGRRNSAAVTMADVQDHRRWVVRFFAEELLLALAAILGVLAGFYAGHAWAGVAVFLLVWGVAGLFLYRDDWGRWRRRKQGRCLHCGYDLTANVSGVCPECG